MCGESFRRITARGTGSGATFRKGAGGTTGRNPVPGHHRVAVYAHFAALRFLLVRPEFAGLVPVVACAGGRPSARVRHPGAASWRCRKPTIGRVAYGFVP